MDIVYFYWSKKCGRSINRSFENLVNELRTNPNLHIKEYCVPYHGSNPIHLLKNIIYVHKRRSKNGINHITGDIHYCILGLLGCTSVLTIHDDYSYKQAKKGIFGKIYKYIFWIYLPIKFATTVLCVTESTKNKIIKLYNNSKIRVFTNHTWPSTYKYYPKTFNVAKPTILHLSTGENKNLETTIRALEGLNASLVVVEKMTDAQKELARSLHVDFINTGRIADEEILTLYVNADIVAFPSSYEGFGMPIVESQLIGRSLITTDAPPMNWVAGPNCYFLENPLDAHEMKKLIVRIISNKAERDFYIAEGLKNAERFSVQRTERELLDIYKRISHV